MNYITSKMYSCHLSDCGQTINSVYIRMLPPQIDCMLIALSRFELLGMYSTEVRRTILHILRIHLYLAYALNTPECDFCQENPSPIYYSKTCIKRTPPGNAVVSAENQMSETSSIQIKRNRKQHCTVKLIK